MGTPVYSEEKKKLITKLYIEDGYSVEEIAEALNQKRRGIISILVRMKIYRKPEKAEKEDYKVKTMIRKLESYLDIKFIAKADGNVNLAKHENLDMLVQALEERFS